MVPMLASSMDATHPPHATRSEGNAAPPAISTQSSTDNPKPPSFFALGSVLWISQPGGRPEDTPPPQIYIGCGRYPSREPGEVAELVYEFRLVGIGGASREPTDSTASCERCINCQ